MLSCDRTKQSAILSDDEIINLIGQERFIEYVGSIRGKYCKHTITEPAYLQDGTTSNCFDYCLVCGNYIG